MEDKNLQQRLAEFLKKGNFPKKESAGKNILEDKELAILVRQLDKLSQQPCRPDKKRIWSNIYGHVQFSKRKQVIRRWWTVAAVLFPALLGSLLFLYFETSQQVQHPLPVAVSRNQVQLFLNDGRVVHVQQVAKNSVLNENGAGILIDTNSSVVYQPINLKNNELVYNTLTVPRCCEYHMVLADGTHVWLNSESELRFPVNFTSNERRVFLKGEAYFEVAKDAAKPFRVEAGALEVEALGTQFDVNAYRDGGKLMATLVEGKVRVADLRSTQTCVLEPGKQALLHHNVLSASNVNVEEVVGWKEGRFVFRNMTLEDMARQLERWYDVKIDFQDMVVRYYRFTGIIKRYNQLNQLIEIIEETTDVKFQVNGREVKICRR